MKMTQKKPKILYLITQSEWGGAQKYIYDLAVNLTESYDIVIAAGQGNGELFKQCGHENIRTLEHGSIRTFRLKHLKRGINPFFDFMALWEIRRLIKTEQPDIVHLNSSKISILGSLANKSIGYQPSIIYTAHGWVFNEPLPGWQKKLYLLLEKFTAKYKDKIICVSGYDKKVALENKICPAEKLIAIHNGIDFNNLDFFDQNTARQNLFNLISNNDSPASPLDFARGERLAIIGAIANLYPTKGLKYLVEAAENVIKEHPQTIFLALGEGQERKNLEAQIKKAGLENNFFLLGNIDQAYRYLKGFDIFVLPSVKEGLPYTLLEAMSAGLPIIATKVGGAPEIIKDNINGLLIEPKNSKQLTEALNKLINNQSLMQQLTSNINLTDFSLEKMIKETTCTYAPRRVGT